MPLNKHIIATRPAQLLACVLITAFASTAIAQDPDRYAPKLPPQDDAPVALPPLPQGRVGDGETLLLDELRGLAFVPDEASLQAEPIRGRGILTVRLPLLDEPAFRAKVQPYLGRPLTLGTLNEITAAVVLHYRAAGRPVVDAIVPEQDITGGVVQVVVLEGRVGQVRVEGNRYFRDEVILGKSRLRSGQPIGERRLIEDLDWMNRNPFRRSDVVFERGARPGETDVILQTQDRLPLRLYTGFEDTGTSATGESRLFAGVNWGNVFGLDHQLNYQFTTSPDYSEFNTHSGSYVVPLPWRHQLTVFGLSTRSAPDMDDGFDLQGESWQASGRYEVPLRRFGRYEHSLTLGSDFKSSNNNLEFGGLAISDQSADVVQFSLGYAGTLADRLGSTGAGITAFYSPGGLTSQNDDETFDQLRPGAEARYAYVQFDANRTTNLPRGFTWVARLQAQVADGPLLGSEQLGFGGAGSVRGYDEREGNGDGGLIVSNELFTPPLSLAQLLGRSTDGSRDSLQFLAFFDYGIADNQGSSTTDPNNDQVQRFASVGPGVRYQIASWLAVRYDHGFRLAKGDPTNGDTNRGHLSVILSRTW